MFKSSIEQLVLLRIAVCAGDAAVAEVGTVSAVGMQFAETVGRLAPTRWKAFAPPNFIEPAAGAVIAIDQIFLSDAEPAGDPDIDGIGFGERASVDLQS